ncbi:MAG: SulP family inorganic anion transporter [Chitinophagales bacterium]|nr:SulP family inorganic anion transporter [Chitinophagales bacterium]
MRQTIKHHKNIWLRHDLMAGISVFLVALPLCLGIALASGAPLYAGIFSGIIGGLIVGILSGAKLAVSGPAAGLATIVYTAITSMGDYRIFLLSVIIAGVFQLTLGILKFGGIVYYFPTSVIKGMLAAIGIMLIVKQFPLVLGLENFSFKEEFHFREVIQGIAPGAVMIAFLSLLVLLIFNYPKLKHKIKLPSSLIAVLVGVMANYVFNLLNNDWELHSSQLVNIPTDVFSRITFPKFSGIFNRLVWENGLVVGLIATLETLLSIEAIDKIDKEKNNTPVNRELIAQGIGNVSCGMIGALPITAVIVRGSANVDAGGKSKLSTITHGSLLLLTVTTIPFILNLIPYASLAAILIITGYNLTKPVLYKSMFALKKEQYIPFIVTIVITLIADLLIGVGIGFLVALYFIVHHNFKADYQLHTSQQNGQEVATIYIGNQASFLNKAKLKKILELIPAGTHLTIDATMCPQVDYDIIEVISDFESRVKEKNIQLELVGIKLNKIASLH